MAAPDEVDAVVLLAPDLAAAMFPSADPVGRRILVNGRPFTVVGVTPDGFHGHDLPGETRMWLPPSATRVLAPYVPSRWPDLREQMLWQVVGRLAPGADVAGAALDLSTVARRIAEAHPGETMFGDRQVPTVSGGVGASPALEARLSRALGRLGIGALILLLLAVANAGGLLVARAAMRERDVVIRRALGASRGAIVQRTVIESLLVAGLAGAVALALTKLALVGIEGLRLLQFGAAVEGARLDARVALFAAVVSAAAGLLTAVAPSMLAARERDLSQTRAGAPRQGLRRGLVIVQVALSVGLSVGAALMGRTVTKLSAVDPGVNIDDVLSFRVAPGLQQDWAPDGEQFFLAQVHSALATLPGARAVAFSWPAPFALQFARATVRRPDEPWDNAVQVRSFRVSPDFFETVELGSRQGPLPSTSSSEGDASGEPGIVVSRRMARLLFPDEDPLGRAVELRGVRGERRVAAVVEDMRVGSPRDAPAPILFEPLGQRRATGDYTVLVRTTGDPKALVPAIRRTLREVAPALPMFDVQTLRERVRRTIAEERTLAGVGAALAALGVLMTGLAIFGILEWAVATREREIGVRMALGAQARRVVGHVAAQALAMIGVGAIVGLPLAWVLARALRSQLFDVTPWDPIAWCGSAVVLLAVAALAAVRPAHRATRADPAEALRAE